MLRITTIKKLSVKRYFKCSQAPPAESYAQVRYGSPMRHRVPSEQPIGLHCFRTVGKADLFVVLHDSQDGVDGV